MTFLSILIALLLERITPQLVELRQFNWLREYIQWMLDVLHIERLGTWGAIGSLFLPLLLAVWVLTGLFENAVFGLFELAFDVAIIFICLGPRFLDSQVDRYLDALEIGETQQQYKLVDELIPETPAQDLPGQVEQFCKALFVEANCRVYAVLFWFVVLGPVAAVFYRVLEQILRHAMLQEPIQRLGLSLRVLLGWLDWIPARFSLFAFMLSGSFEEGLRAIRNSSVCASDTYENNIECLQSVGFQSISAEQVVNENQAMALVRKSRGLILRSLVVWLLLLFILSLII